MTSAVPTGYWSPAEGPSLVGGIAGGQGEDTGLKHRDWGAALSSVHGRSVWPCAGDRGLLLSMLCLREKGEVLSPLHWATEALPAH